MFKIFFPILLFLSFHTYGQDIANSKIILDFPIVDLPFLTYSNKTNFATGNTWLNPSMNQSVSLSSNVYFAAHNTLKKIILKNEKNKVLKKIGLHVAVFGLDGILAYVPFGHVWVHEEFHRSIMTKNLVGSQDDANKFMLFANGLKVSGIRDEDLSRMKKENPRDFVRLDEAGIEGDYQFIHNLQKNNFYFNQQLPNEVLYNFSTLFAIGYIYSTSKPQFNDKIVDEDNKIENNILKRDFAGPDLSGWAYHLFNQNQPLENLGLHPTGIGINRYIKTTQLKPDELSYLNKQGNLAFLNLVSPMLYGFRRIPINYNGKTNYVNFALRHYLTSFGNDICFHTFYQNSKNNWLYTIHNYNNVSNHFVGVEVENFMKSIVLNKKTAYLNTRAMLWTQPQNQEYNTSKNSLGGLIETKLNYPIYKNLYSNASITVKTNGWVAGNEYLNSNFSFKAGVSMILRSSND